MSEFEGEPQVAEPEVEVADAEVAPESAEASQPEAASGETGNWWDVSGIKDETAVKRIKSIQTEFQRHAERVKELERERIAYQNQMQAIANDVKATIANPEKYREYRRRLGYQDDIPAQPKPKEFTLDGVETLPDLERRFADAIASERQQAEAKMQAALARQQFEFEQRVGMVAEPVAKERWETALNSMKSKYGAEFSAREHDIVQKIVNGPWKSMYGTFDEKALLEKAFIAEFPQEAMRAMSKRTQETREKKQAAATTTPKRKGGKTTPSGNAREDALAALRDAGYSFES